MGTTVDGFGAAVKEGKLVETASTASTSKAAKGNGLDKDAFLQLLVAQMKYQDPLEPTSNTEYISQYATFSELEQMQNMSSTLELSRASTYVGQTVTIRTTMSTGEIKEIEGKVDYVVFENNKALLSVNGELYSASDVYATVDAEYKAAFDLAMAFAKAMNGLPSLDDITLSDKDVVANLQEGFNSMSGYQQSFIANDYIESLKKYVARMDELQKAADGESDTTPPEDEGDGDDGGEGETI